MSAKLFVVCAVIVTLMWLVGAAAVIWYMFL
jgi:hypothetical protein